MNVARLNGRSERPQWEEVGRRWRYEAPVNPGQNGCEYCIGRKGIGYSWSPDSETAEVPVVGIDVGFAGNLLCVKMGDGTHFEYDIDYCPMCGRLLP